MGEDYDTTELSEEGREGWRKLYEFAAAISRLCDSITQEREGRHEPETIPQRLVHQHEDMRSA